MVNNAKKKVVVIMTLLLFFLSVAGGVAAYFFMIRSNNIGSTESKASETTNTINLRVMTYNIMYAGQDNPRLQIIANLIASRRVDVVAFEESRGFDGWILNGDTRINTIDQIVNDLKTMGVTMNMYKQDDVSIISVYPITYVAPTGSPDKSLLTVDVNVQGNTVRFRVIHPLSGAEAAACTQVNNYVTELSASNVPFIILGDYNITGTNSCFRNMLTNRGLILSCDPLRDTVHCVDSVNDEVWQRAGNPTDPQRYIIDHIVFPQSSGITVREAYVIDSDQYSKSSDHFPVFAVLRIPTQTKVTPLLSNVPDCNSITFSDTNFEVGKPVTISTTNMGTLTQSAVSIMRGTDCSQSVFVQFNQTAATNPSFTWTPSETGDFTVFCRVWNDGIAEARGSCVDQMPRYLTIGDNSSIKINVSAGSATTVPVTTVPVTTAPVTTAPVTTVPVTTAPVTTAPVTTVPVTTVPVTTAPVTTVPVTTAPVTAVPAAGYSVCDYNRDNKVNLTDYYYFVQDYNYYKNTGTFYSRSDFNSDNKINMSDYYYFVNEYKSH